jgi:hypothetical protein
LERIDELRYEIADDSRTTHSRSKQSEKNVTRKRKRTPDILTEVMRNAKRRLLEPEAEAKEQKEVEASGEVMEDSRASEVVANQSLQQVKEEFTGSTQQTSERNMRNERVS